MSRLDATCPDCGGPMYRYAQTCSKCKGKGERNSRYGAVVTPETRAKLAAVARRRTGPRGGTGHDFARRWFPMPAWCERCRRRPPRDRHHRDGDPGNNDPTNIAFLCRRCHQEVDGRADWLRAPKPPGGRLPRR